MTIRDTDAPIKLSFRSVENVIIEADDEDRFLITAKEAARACKQADGEKGFQEEFKRFLHHIREWCVARHEQVSVCYVCVGDGTLNIFVRTAGDHYNFEFEDELSTLDIDLVKKFSWLIAEVLQVPSSLEEKQLTDPHTIVVYGNERGTPEPSRA